MLQQDGTIRSHVPVPGPQSRKESNHKGENPRSIVAPEPEHAGSRHSRDDGMWPSIRIQLDCTIWGTWHWGLADRPRPGRPLKIKPDRIRALIAETAGITTSKQLMPAIRKRFGISYSRTTVKRTLHILHVVQKVKIDTRKQTRNRRDQK